MNKFLDSNGLQTLINNIKNLLNNKANINDIPTKTSDLTNDSNYVTSNVLATVATSGSYNDLSNKPTSMPANGGTADTLQRNLILESTDLNTIPSTIGIGKLKYTELSGAMTNAPTDYNNASNPWGHLLTTTHSYSTNNWTQLLLGMTFDGMYYRNADNTNWKTILDSSNWSSIIAEASTSANGLMSSSDKTKINAIPTEFAVSKISTTATTTAIPTGAITDFNSATTPGLYTMKGVSTNAPTSGSYHSLLVMKSDTGNYYQQLAIKEGTTDVYVRYRSASTWSSWVRLAKLSDISGGGDFSFDSGSVNMTNQSNNSNYISFNVGNSHDLALAWGNIRKQPYNSTPYHDTYNITRIFFPITFKRSPIVVFSMGGYKYSSSLSDNALNNPFIYEINNTQAKITLAVPSNVLYTNPYSSYDDIKWIAIGEW